MIGTWLRFGEGPPPTDGEPLVWLRLNDDIIAALDGYAGQALMAIHRGGTLYGQDGSTQPLPFGCWWTSLPPASARG